MFLKEDGTAKTLYLSQASFPAKIFMNVYENHLSLITDHKMYSKQYICNQCDKVSMKMSNHLRHQSKCDGTGNRYILVVCIKINCLYLRRKWVFVRMRRISMKSSLCVTILRRISGIFVKV